MPVAEPFVEELFQDITAGLGAQLNGQAPEHGQLLQLRRTILKKFSVIFICDMHSNGGGTSTVLAKTKKEKKYTDLRSAIFNERQTNLAREEYRRLQATSEAFKDQPQLHVPEPVAFLESLNTIVFTQASGGDFSHYVNAFSRKLSLPENQKQEIARIAGLIGKWIAHYHSKFAIGDLEVTRETLVNDLLFNDETIAKYSGFIAPDYLRGLRSRIEAQFPEPAVRVPTAHLHGDFKHRHIWNDGDRGVTAFDFGNKLGTEMVYEDLAGFLVETILLGFGLTLHKFNGVPEIIENSFLEAYDPEPDPRVLCVFVLKYLVKKWTRRKVRVQEFCEKYAGRDRLFPITQLNDIYIDAWFKKRIDSWLQRLS